MVVVWGLAESPFSDMGLQGPEKQSVGLIYRRPLLNDWSFSFSKKRERKWLVGILQTEVWASDCIPYRPGTVQTEN